MNILEYQNQSAKCWINLHDDLKNVTSARCGIMVYWGKLVEIFNVNLFTSEEIWLPKVEEIIGYMCWYAANLCRFVDDEISEDFVDSVKEEAHEHQIPMEEAVYELVSMSDVFSDLDTPASYLLLATYMLGLALGIDMDKVLENNIAKLKVRFPDKFSEEKALTRDLVAERVELEK